ncbi:alpha-E domain-containing protein [Lewinella sp. IMCC34191]|uniref:alpha-E domain-containing protein n=1 Tax=Lewinella sp. IMCC34191 TaxID=2259172 RepID=UPI000E22FCF1|nr:alpha-E domain-containing protein [Lewinella sp. IMCC34191]
MLARIASTLYWTGRYIERSEHLARYLRVQYFSMLDAPMSQSKDFILQSILNMYGTPFEEGGQLVESEVLQKVGMDYGVPTSIRSTVKMARENAGSLRHVISTELWEAINAFYLYSHRTDPEDFAVRGLYDYTFEVGRQCAIIRSRIHDTLLHDQSWVFVKLGIHLERVAQVIRIVNSKLNDADVISDSGGPNENKVLKLYQQTILLKVVEGFDMHRRAYQRRQTRRTTLEFLIGHPEFSRSITYNMERVVGLLARLNGSEDVREPVQYRAGKLYAYFRYLDYDAISDNPIEALNTALVEVYSLHDDIERKYFNSVSTPTSSQSQSQHQR